MNSKGINFMVKRAQIQKRNSPRLTLLAMNVGETVKIPTKHIQTPAIRTAATRMEQKREARFVITTAGLTNETQVTRIR